jgi:hypothetical protein
MWTWADTWPFITSCKQVPRDRNLLPAVIDHIGPQALEFPCRYIGNGDLVDALRRKA